MTSRLISLDPSIQSCGVADWIEGCLTRVARISLPIRDDAGLLDRGVEMAAAVLEWVRAGAPRPRWHLISEYPQAYAPGRAGGGPARDLIPMALVIGAVASRCPGEVSEVLPGTWTGGTPKVRSGDPREAPRGVRIWSRLDETERAIAASCLQHDAWDAIGIGLWCLGRFGRRRGQKPGADVTRRCAGCVRDGSDSCGHCLPPDFRA